MVVTFYGELILRANGIRPPGGLVHEVWPDCRSAWREDKPLFRAAVNHFGDWQNARRAAGLEIKPRRSWSKERILSDLRRWYCEGQRNVRLVDPALAGVAARFLRRSEWPADQDAALLPLAPENIIVSDREILV